MSGTLAIAEIGGTSVKIGFAVDGHPTTVARTFPTLAIRGEDPAGRLARLIGEAGAAGGLVPTCVVATVPGLIDRDFDTVLSAANVPELDGHRLASELSSHLGVPARLERDVVLQLLGELRAGAVRGRADVLGIYLGTGIGAAYVGREGVFRGGGWALEIGHMPMRPPRPGDAALDLEAHASGATLVSIATRHGVAVADVFGPTRDRALRDAVAGVVEDQGLAIAAAVTLFSPRTLLIGGGVAEMAFYPRDRLAASVRRCLPLSRTVQPLEIVDAALGWRAAIWGALALTDAAEAPTA